SLGAVPQGRRAPHRSAAGERGGGAARGRGLRIVGGEARGRSLRPVPGSTTRPTADRVRQSLFDLLGQRMDGLAVLDLYAGTGALALEAVSRGAASAALIEKDARACGVIFHNVSALKYDDRSRVVRAEVPEALR